MTAIEQDLEGTPYRHVRPLAQGGMGEVHVVDHRALHEQRVMKVLKVADPAMADELGKRLMAEGRALRGLRHENVVEVLDLGVTRSGRPFLVTELLQGRTLREEVDARGPMPWREALGVASAILSGLDAAHQHGVVHRDLKPLNIFYLDPAPSGRRGVKILDFGIAKAVTGDAQARAGSALVATRAGIFAGSPPFVSPEQGCGLPVDARSDLYSLGAVVFYLLTSRPPFAGRTMAELITAHVTEAPVAPSARQPGVPLAVDAVVLRALAKGPEERYGSASQMRAAIVALLDAPREEVSEAPQGATRAQGKHGTAILHRPASGPPAERSGQWLGSGGFVSPPRRRTSSSRRASS